MLLRRVSKIPLLVKLVGRYFTQIIVKYIHNSLYKNNIDAGIRYNSYRSVVTCREMTENHGILYLGEYLCILFITYIHYK